jgi:hypothetical protein
MSQPVLSLCRIAVKSPQEPLVRWHVLRNLNRHRPSL